MLSRVQALRYRCFRDLDVRLPQYSVLAGGNGSGKSTLMDIPLLFSDMLSLNNLVQAFLEPSPSTGVTRSQRLQELIHCYSGDSFSFALEAPLPEHVIAALNASALKQESHTVRYEVRFQIVNEIELHVTDEFLWLVPEMTAQHETKHHIGSPHLSNPPAIVCLEEPENGIHPRAIESILESLSSLYDSQVLLSTHSPIVLASTALPSVTVMQSEESGEKTAIVGGARLLGGYVTQTSTTKRGF